MDEEESCVISYLFVCICLSVYSEQRLFISIENASSHSFKVMSWVWIFNDASKQTVTNQGHKYQLHVTGPERITEAWELRVSCWNNYRLISLLFSSFVFCNEPLAVLVKLRLYVFKVLCRKTAHVMQCNWIWPLSNNWKFFHLASLYHSVKQRLQK